MVEHVVTLGKNVVKVQFVNDVWSQEDVQLVGEVDFVREQLVENPVD